MKNFLRYVRGPIPLAICLAVTCGCQMLTYTGANGEHFSRTAFASATSISSLAIETDTNGVRRVQMQGYQNDASQALGVVTDAAVRAALQTPK